MRFLLVFILAFLPLSFSFASDSIKEPNCSAFLTKLGPHILDSSGEIKQEAIGTNGLLKITEKLQVSWPLTVWGAAKKLLGNKFNELNWGKAFLGLTEEYQQTRDRLIIKGKPNPKYLNPEGYIAYADEFTNSAMQKAFMNASAVLTEKEFKSLGWGKAFLGLTEEYQKTRERLIIKGKPNPKYQNPEGYIAYADEFTNSAMQKAFMNASAVLTDKEFDLLNWGRSFSGSTTEYKEIRGMLVFEDGRLNLKDYQGKEGFELLAHVLSSDNKSTSYTKACRNIRAVLTDEEIEQFGWRKYKSGKKR